MSEDLNAEFAGFVAGVSGPPCASTFAASRPREDLNAEFAEFVIAQRKTAVAAPVGVWGAQATKSRPPVGSGGGKGVGLSITPTPVSCV